MTYRENSTNRNRRIQKRNSTGLRTNSTRISSLIHSTTYQVLPRLMRMPLRIVYPNWATCCVMRSTRVIEDGAHNRWDRIHATISTWCVWDVQRRRGVDVDMNVGNGKYDDCPLLFISDRECFQTWGKQQQRFFYRDRHEKWKMIRLSSRANRNFPKTDKNRSGSGIGIENLRRRLQTYISFALWI